MNTLQVTSSKLKTASDQFKTTGQKVKHITDGMLNEIKAINGAVWEGDAATAYKNQFAKLEEDMNQIFKMIQEYDTDLDQIAAEYDKVEKANSQVAQSLATDVVSF